MIVEHAILNVKPAEADAFESAFAVAKSIIAASPGFERLTLARGIERPNAYLLRVEWSTLSDHTDRFRGSPAYEEWRGLLHHFYDPMPTVEHFEPIAGA
jgi:heme-degrading monooxygenase HmoA